MAVVLVCAAALIVGSSARANTFFDFTQDPLNGGSTPGAFTPAPFLYDSNVGAVNTFLGTQSVKAVKVMAPLSPSTISTIYGSQVVKYTFSDFEGGSALANTTALRNAIAGGAANPLPAGVYYGNYEIYPISGDPTRPAGYTPAGFVNYMGAKVNIASEMLYPGSFMFRTKLEPGNPNSNSNAPSTVSALFTLPVTRFSLVQATLPLGHKHIPYVTRFNNMGNDLLNDTGTGSQYRWSNPEGNQMLSRGDFKAMVAHYRLRGADGVHLLDGGVEGYSTPDFQNDAMAGWNVPQIQAIYAGGNAKSATLDTTILAGGSAARSLEEAGMVFSGVYSLTQDGGKGKLALLVSNMTANPLALNIATKIGGKSIINLPQMGSGHTLLEFTGAGTQWQLIATTPLFNTSIETDRTGVGVPEPTMMGGVALLAVLGLARRRRN